jgi:hypothetical protein
MESDGEDEAESSIQTGLDSQILHIAKENEYLLQNIDFFVALSRDNTIVTEVILYPFDSDAGNYEVWDKVGQIVGNLMELKTLQIFLQPLHHFEDGDGDEVHMPDWETLTRILPYLRRKVALIVHTDLFETEGEEMIGLARAIHGHPMISGFISQMDFNFANFIPWCSTLATLPHLERISFGLQEPETEDQLELVNLQPLTELLRTPALRLVRFFDFYFTDALCRATANALEERSSVIDIIFDNECTFPDGGRAIIANALKRNTSVTAVKFLGDCDESLCNALAVALLSNATLQNLTLYLSVGAGGRWFFLNTPLFGNEHYAQEP